MWNLGNCFDQFSSYFSFRIIVPCIYTEVSWICALATLSEQLVYLEGKQNQLKYEGIKNCFAQMMLQLLIENLLDYENLDLNDLIITRISQH